MKETEEESFDSIGWKNDTVWGQPRTVILDAAEFLPYELGAIILSYWAFPAAKDENLRQLAAVALCKRGLQQKSQRSPDWGQQPGLIRPIHALLPEDDAVEALRTYKRRVRDRIHSFQMIGGNLSNHIKDITGLNWSISSLASQWAEKRFKEKDIQNILSRVWRPSLPVLHITGAILCLVQLRRNRGYNLHYLGVTYSEIFSFLVVLSSVSTCMTSTVRLQYRFRSLMNIEMINIKRSIKARTSLWPKDDVADIIKSVAAN